MNQSWNGNGNKIFAYMCDIDPGLFSRKMYSEIEIKFGKEIAVYIKENLKRFLMTVLFTKGKNSTKKNH